MSDTPINLATLSLADLKASDPPPAGTNFNGRPPGLRRKFKELIKQAPGVWYEYPLVTTGGLGESNNNTDGFQWTTRSEVNGDGKRMIRTWGRYNPPATS